MSDTKISVEGLDRTVDRVQLTRLAMSGTVDKATKEGAVEIRKFYRKAAPVRTGRLRKGIKVKRLRKGDIGYLVKPAGRIAMFQEYGTSRGVKPKYFRKRTIEEKLPEVQRKVMEKISKAVD